MKNFTVQEKEKLSKFLLKAYDGGLSFSVLNKLLRKKDILVNGKRVSKDQLVLAGDNIVVYFDGEKAVNYKTLYKDDNILVVVKPKGVTSEDFYNQLNIEKNLFFCHRLDRNTDGIMIFAYNQMAYEQIVSSFKEKSFSKYYTAEVYGNLNENALLEGYLLKDSKSCYVTILDKPKKGAVYIKTGYKVMEKKAETTILEVELLTGRTHQIRAHLAHIGHFIIGDGKYGVNSINKKLGAKQLRLSATRLVLHFKKDTLLGYLDGKTFNFN